ncbi:MAG: hypothetical protein AB7E05_13885 [Sphingobium sp.]
MKHFWLDSDQQALMDSATSTANEYTHIAAVKLGKSWKRELKGQTGFSVADRDYLRTYNVMRTSGLDFDSLVRLTAGQAMTMKLRYAGMDDGVVQPDPTGECWGNMLIAQHDQTTGNYWGGFRQQAYWPFLQFCAGYGFGPIIATVANHCAGLPLSWATRLVWRQVSQWHHASKPAETAFGVPEPYREAFEDLFEQPEHTFGQSWARQWWARCQSVAFRRSMAIPDAINERVL